jgi:hypothetical protein
MATVSGILDSSVPILGGRVPTWPATVVWRGVLSRIPTSPAAAPPSTSTLICRGDRPRVRRIRSRSVDTANPSGADLRYDTFDGLLVLDSRSDIDVQAGVEALQKRILRRLMSRPGGFFHLPRYGVGLRAKEVRRTTSLMVLRADVEAQVREEDEVEDVSVEVSAPTTGVLVVIVRASLTWNRTMVLTVSVPDDGPIEVW